MHAKLHECHRCGRKLPAEKMTYSRFTSRRYCGIDWARCDKVAARRMREKVPAGRETA